MQGLAQLALQAAQMGFVARLQVRLEAQFLARFARLQDSTSRVRGQDRESRPAETGQGFGLRGDTSRGWGSA